MAKKVRRKKAVDSKTSVSLSEAGASLCALKKDILDIGNREKFLRQLAASDLKEYLPSFENLLTLKPAEIPLDNSISHVGGFEEVAEGRFWISDEFNHRIVELNGEWQVIRTFGEFGAGDSGFYYPRAIQKLRNNEVAIVDSWNHRVKFYDLDGNYVDSIGGYGTGEGCFFEPAGVAEDTRGFLYVLDRCNHRVVVFYQKNFLFHLGSRGTRDEYRRERFLAINPSTAHQFLLEFPTDIQCRNGRLYIADSGNNRIVVFDVKGTSCQVLEGFNAPQQIAFFGGTLMVADMNNQRIVHLWESGETAFSYRLSSSSPDEGVLYPQSIFPGKGSLLFGFSNSQRLVELPLTEEHVLAFLEKEQVVTGSHQFLLHEAIKALETGNDEKVLSFLEGLSRESKDGVDFSVIELFLTFFQRTLEGLQYPARITALLEQFICIGKKRLQKVIGDFEVEQRNLFNARMAYVEAEEKYRNITVPEEEKGCGEDCYTQKGRFEKQEAIFFSTSQTVYDTVLLLKQLLAYQISYKPQERLGAFKHLLDLNKMFLDPLVSVYQRKGRYLSYAYEEYVKNDLNDEQNWIKFAKSSEALKEEEKGIALLLDNVASLCPMLTKNLQMVESNWGETTLLMDVTGKLLEFSLCLRLEPLANKNKNDAFVKTIELYLEAFSKKFPSEVSLGANPEIVSLLAFLTHEINELPMSMTPLTNLQILLSGKRGFVREELSSLASAEASVHELDRALGSIITSSQELEEKLMAVNDEFNKQSHAWGEKRHMLTLILNDQRQISFLLRELRTLEFGLDRSEHSLRQSLYQHLVLISYILLGNYALFQRCLRNNDMNGALQAMENIFQMKDNFARQVELTGKENNTVMEVRRRRAEGIRPPKDNSFEEAKRQLQAEKQYRVTSVLLEHFSLLMNIASNSFDLLLEDFNLCREGNLQDDRVREFLGKVGGNGDLKDLLSSLIASESKGATEEKEVFTFTVEAEWMEDEDNVSIVQAGGNFLLLSPKTGEVRRYTRDWIDLGTVLQIDKEGGTLLCAALDGQNNLYVPGKKGLLVYGLSFELIRVYPFHGMVRPQDILSITIINENVYMCDPINDRILSLDLGRGEDASFKVACDRLEKPLSLLPLKEERMLLTTFRGERLLQIVDKDWNVLCFFDNSREELSSAFFRAAAQDDQGRLWVTGPREGALYVFDEELNYLFSYGQGTPAQQKFVAPRKIAYADNAIYVVDTALNRLSSIRALEQ